MDPLDLKTNEELLIFFNRKKAEMSCIQQPHRLLTQLRDHNLVPEKHFEVHSCKQKEKGFCEVLDWLEKDRPQEIRQFWRCVFEDHILKLYPTLRMLKNSLLDSPIKCSEKPLDRSREDNDDPDLFGLFSVSTPSPKKPHKNPSFCPIKCNEKPLDRSRDDNENPDLFGLFSVSTPSPKKPHKNPSFCPIKLYEKPLDVETLTEEEESEEKEKKWKEKSQAMMRHKDDRSSVDIDYSDLSLCSHSVRRKPLNYCSSPQGPIKLHEKPLNVETVTEEESEGMTEKGNGRNYKRKGSQDDRSSEDNASSPSREKPAKKPTSLTSGQEVDRPAHRRLTESEFVDKNRHHLIQRVSSVMVIADGLRAKDMITGEMYSEVEVEKPHQKQMRLLFKVLDSGGDSVKAEFYRLLKENQPRLVDDLDSKAS